MMTNDDMKVSWWIYLFVLLGTAMKIGNASELRVASNITWPSDGICPSIDVRTSIDNFVKLRGCHVIEGNLHILLIEKANETHYANISFPELTEITGFLLLYRVSGLISLSRLFPNLAVIRGQSIIFNYAFAVYEMSHLQDIGLISLTHIERGAVYIAKNSNLCFVNTIDWDRITLKGKGGNFITQNKPENECPMCPGDEKVNEFDGEILKECPVRYTNEEKSPQNARHLCWNRKHCQKVCPDDCKACNSRSECCSELCLSSCSDNDPTNCTVCQFLATGKMCAKTCPVNTVKFMNRRCVDEDTCRKIKRPKEADPSITTHFHKPHDGICLLDCPSNYSEGYENDKLVCKKCNGTCHIDCPGRKVDSIRSAQSLHGCTHILGSLEIQIRGGGENIVNELDANLKDIIEIKGYLKIVRSFPIVSLSFLRSLQVIRGDVLDSNRYSFIVMDNPNLQELWNFNSSSGERKFKIEKGRLCFHYNSKLCYSKIEQLRIAAGLNKSLDLEVDRKSNGEKTACTVSNLDVEMDPQADGIILKWKPFKMDEYRHLLGYVVYWIESPTRNLSLYESRDACDDDSWQVDDAKSGDNDTEYIYHPLTRLKPYTQYAFYVKTYTVATEESGAHSQIYYFRTFPGKPTPVVNLDATSNASHVFISWLPPDTPNGNLTHYVVTVRLKTDDAKLSEERNYCNVPITKEPPKQKYIQQEKPDTCSCKEKKISTDNTKPFRNGLRDEKNVLLQKSFEDELHNLIYVKRIPLPNNVNNRQKREVVTSDSFYQNSLPIASYFSTNESGSVWTFNHTSTNCVLKDLHHFSEYTISIKACREPHERDKGNDSCSDDSFTTVRTRPLPNADDIKSFRTSVQTSNESLGMIRLEWDEPVDPNGVILTYRIEYKKLSNENLQPTIECITRKKHSEAKNSYTIMNLSPGNYSVRLMATSLRGDGGYTSYQYVYIEAVDKNHTAEVVGLIFGIIIVMVFGIFIGTILYLRRNYMRGVPNMKLIASVNPEYVSTAYVPDDWEVPRKKIELLRELGQGSFGMVYEGVARDVVRGYPEMRCAIKTVNEHATDRERIEFLNEASVMKAFDTQHVVRLLGVVSQGQPTLVVMELMANGDLKSYLRSHRPEEQDPNNPRKESPPSLKRILQMAIEIADGMAYLTAKKFVHRDLAARNCMVSENLTVKIGDFGMTRDIYETDYYRKGTKGLLPVRWMAPESLKDGVFTSSSDVWSYGVVLWEMATLASQPYQGLSNDQVLRYVVDGGIMERPENCPDKLYDLMRRCWQHKSSARPTFLGLATMLLPDASQEFRQGAFYFTKIGQEALAAQSTQQVEEAEATTPLRPAVDNDDDFSIDDSCSDRDELTDGENTAVVSEARYPAPYRTAAYRDAAPGSSLPAANGYVLGCPANNGVGNVKITEC